MVSGIFGTAWVWVQPEGPSARGEKIAFLGARKSTLYWKINLALAKLAIADFFWGEIGAFLLGACDWCSQKTHT
jgi:hypothetical protein